MISRHGGIPRVLIVDDDADYLEDMRAMLGDEFVVETAASSSEGLRMFTAEVPDCMIIDLQMKCHFGHDPDTEGYALLREMQKAVPSAGERIPPALVVSSRLPDSWPDPRSADIAIIGALTKPPNMNKLRMALHKLISGAAEEDDLSSA